MDFNITENDNYFIENLAINLKEIINILKRNLLHDNSLKNIFNKIKYINSDINEDVSIKIIKDNIHNLFPLLICSFLKKNSTCHLTDIITTDFFSDFLLNIDENDKKFFSSFFKFITAELDYIPENQTKMFFDIILLNSLINSIEYKDNETSKNNYINEFVDKYKDYVVIFDYIPYIKESLNKNFLNNVDNENFENILSKFNSIYCNKTTNNKNKKIKI